MNLSRRRLLLVGLPALALLVPACDSKSASTGSAEGQITHPPKGRKVPDNPDQKKK